MAGTFKLPVEDILDTVRSIMGKENFPLSANDLKEPTSPVIVPVFTAIVERILDISIPKQVPFAAMQMLDHPGLYEDYLARMRLLKCLQLASRNALVPIEVDIGDLIMPERKRTRILLNCLINYLRHCMQNDEKLHEIEKNLTVLRKESNAKEERLQRLQEQLAALQAERRHEEPETLRLVEKGAQLKAEIDQLNLDQSELRATLLSLKESSASQQVKLEGQRVENAKAKQTVEDLRAQIVESPDRLKAQNAERAQEVAGLRNQVQVIIDRRQKCLEHLADLQKLAAEVVVQQEQVTKLKEQRQGMVGIERHISDIKTDMDELRLHLKRLTLQTQSLKEEQEQEGGRFTRQQLQLRMQSDSLRQHMHQHQEQEQQIMADEQQQVCEMNQYLDEVREVNLLMHPMSSEF